ncbi:MAG: pyridoxamine 5'-phosphate oxidase family protein [Alphaproteobacteria bacterium]|nr:pyridoxamine 5'-phosphate oxidase family protein [Alphaproteobacteria bacterium]
MSQQPPSDRVRLRRVHERARYDRDAIDAVLDAGMLCHVGYVFDGAPYVTPTLYWREGDRVYWHGSSASRMLRAVDGVEVCLTVSHNDGLVLARSAFHHSVNYRSVMLLGRADKETDSARMMAHLETFMERILPGRWAELRPPLDKEIKATTMLSMAIDEVSAKIRSGPPVDDDEDYDWPVWAGVVPFHAIAGPPEPDPRLLPDVPLPAYIGAVKPG